MKTKEIHVLQVTQRLARCKANKNRSIQLKFIAIQWLNNTKLRVKESSYVKYHNMIQNHILPELGAWKMEQLTTEAVEQFIQKKLESGRKNGKGGLSEKTVQDLLTILKEICRYAMYLDIKVPCHFELVKIRHCAPKANVLDRQSCIELVRFLLQDNSLKKTGILLSLYMGLRLGEVCALKRQHILYKEGILCIRNTMQRIQNLDGEGKKTKIIITEPKSPHSIRDLPIPALLMERLEYLKEFPEDAYLLTGSRERFIEPRTLENILKGYLQACNIENMNYHVLRHTFATRYIEEGFDAKSLSEILGHANVNITLDRYVHSSMKQKRENMDKILPYSSKPIS